MPEKAPNAMHSLPAVRYDSRGKRHIDFRAIIALAGPLFVNSAMQAVLNLVDMWFIGRLSVDAMAAMGATFFPVITFIVLFGGVSMGVQTLVAQNHGARRPADAAKAVWTGLYGVLIMTPLFVIVAFMGAVLFAPFKLPPAIEALALEFWFPRLIGGPFGLAFWAISGFFNGIGRTKVTLIVSIGMVALNAVLNEILIFQLGMGIAGAGWATTISVLVGAIASGWLFLHPAVREKFQSHKGWRFDFRALRNLFTLGLPMGLFATVDLFGFSLFQLMQVQLGAVDGAATQVVMMLNSAVFHPALGLGMASTTLVGQSIGAGDKDWAMRVGTATIMLAVGYMGIVGVLIALAGPWLTPLFISASDPNAGAVIQLSTTLLWIAAAYHVFDGLGMANFSLRGAGDSKTPAIALIFLSWFGFVPLVHTLTFGPGQGWVEFLPQLGWGAVGGWIAALVYMVLYGVLIFWRWRSGAWRNMKVLE
ncbi:MAG TPA: MATE family efflux transporter [Burkholderiales bacterium]|nr:MATE family efflux transporter [Burkholderiales bacterium]